MQPLAFYWQLPLQPLGRLEWVDPVSCWDQLVQVQENSLILTEQFSLSAWLASVSDRVSVYSTFLMCWCTFWKNNYVTKLSVFYWLKHSLNWVMSTVGKYRPVYNSFKSNISNTRHSCFAWRTEPVIQFLFNLVQGFQISNVKVVYLVSCRVCSWTC